MARVEELKAQTVTGSPGGPPLTAPHAAPRQQPFGSEYRTHADMCSQSRRQQ